MNSTIPTCQVCHGAPGCVRDPHVGPACADCYMHLTLMRGALEEIGLGIGLGGCAPRFSEISNREGRP